MASVQEVATLVRRRHKEARPQVDRSFRRLHVRRLNAKIARTPRWRVTNYGRNVMGTAILLRKHHFPNVYSDVVH